MEGWAQRAKEAAAVLKEKAAELQERAVELHEERIKPMAAEAYSTLNNYYHGESDDADADAKPTAARAIASPDSVFGRRLCDAPVDATTRAPAVVALCVARVAAAADEHVGLYRISGAHSQVERVRALFTIYTSPREADLDCDVDTAASVLKGYFRELAEPILPPVFASFDSQCDADGKCSPATLNTLTALCSTLPLVNFYTLKLLLAHLDEVQSHADINKMSLGNLSIVFSPTLQIGSNLLICFIKNRKALFMQQPQPQETSSSAPNKPLRKPAPPPPPPSKRTLSTNSAVNSPAIISSQPQSPPVAFNLENNSNSRVSSLPPPPRSRTPVQQPGVTVPPRPGSSGIVAAAVNRFSSPELSQGSQSPLQKVFQSFRLGVLVEGIWDQSERVWYQEALQH
ncbi:Rho GTPase activation protein [Rhizoclosmatium globosum]|uniref:Rho GTPase activation protein n=1 Tax=Rhizoclosmatium globosum TaxID=329046 RepID=A0A1Y2C2I0_9FUNG|nr:Rho GTPase activation protein [Rhizoclosmatium globosum]|eukprot:ORY41253.1 Rho GTPase activation protein [Rhizoclosmatium globosum]